MRTFARISALLLLTTSLLAQTAAKQPADPKTAAPAASTAGLPTPELANTYFQRMFGYDTNMQVHVASIGPTPVSGLSEVVAVFVTPEGQQVTHWYVSSDMKYVISGDLLPFGADPFAADREVLAKSAFGPTRGPVNAKLTFVEFADLECPSCRDAQPAMEKLMADYPDARFIFQSLPLEQLHPWAMRASSYLDCIARSNNDQAFTFAQSVFSHQKDIETIVRRTNDQGKVEVSDADVTERMRHYAQMAGADPDKTQACAQSPETAARILKSQQLARQLGVNSTPTLFVNGRRVGNPGGVQYEGLKALIAFELEQVK